ncbi:hypothetical protein [Bradyrhizobium ganzhouense]|uniref:hypothetical protein n=1 Tax=Bradyrhizobium ganzhouense TaxID=1179767 RepID=UPI003CFA3799
MSEFYQALQQIAKPDAEIELPADATSLDFLQAVYRDPQQTLPVRMRAAIAALPFERPKLAVIANVNSFAAQMEAIARQSGRSNVIDASPIPKTLAAKLRQRAVISLANFFRPDPYRNHLFSV